MATDEPTLLNLPNLEIRHSPGKGRGVFAAETIAPGQLIERAPVIAFSSDQWAILEKSFFYDYVFAWGADGSGGALVLGYGSLYNHDYQPNAYYVRREQDNCVEFIALHQIQPGDEITVNYNGNPHCQDLVWFDSGSQQSPVA